MLAALTLSDDATRTAGILLLAVVAVESGGLYMLRVVRGQVPLTPFQQAFARAGHAHAGVLVTLSLVALLYADAADLSGLAAAVARSGIPLAAILMPAGFFFSSMGKERRQPNGLVALVYLGALSLAAGAVTLGIALLTA
jgi:hypothetical protein